MMDKKVFPQCLIISVGVVFASIVAQPRMGSANPPLEIAVTVNPGGTVVDFEAATGEPEDTQEDWSNFHIGGGARAFMYIFPNKNFQIGGELAGQRLYYSYHVIPYGSSPIYREYNIGTFSISALGRYTYKGFFAVGGLGLHIFGNGGAASLCVEAGYKFNYRKKLGFPVSLHLSPIFGDGTPFAITVRVGVSFNFMN